MKNPTSARALPWVLVVLLLTARGAVATEPDRLSPRASPREPGLSPTAIVAAPDGKRLYVACASARAVFCLDGAAGTVVNRVEVPGVPSGLAITADGARLFVTCASAASRICEIETARGTIVRADPAGHTAQSPVLAPDGKTLFVCNRFDDCVTIHDLEKRRGLERIAVPREPFSAAVTADGKHLLVAHHLHEGRADGGVVSAGVSVVDLATRKVVKHLSLPNGSGLLREIRISPDGRLAAVAHNLARFQMPTTQIDRGWINTSALTLIDVSALAVINTVLLDNVDRGAANPWAVGWTPDNKTLAVTQAGTHDLSVIDVPALLTKLRGLPTRPDPSRPVDPYSASRVAADVPNDLSFLVGLRTRVRLTGNGPRSVAVMGSRLFVAHYFSDSVDRIDLASKPMKPAAILLGPPPVTSTARRGEMLFNDASISFQGWQSCASCHSHDGRVDGLNWDLLNDGIGNPKNTKSLLWAHRTPPAMSTAVRETAESAVRAGLSHILFTVQSEDVAAALDCYLKSLEPVPSPKLEGGRLSPAALRGEAVFRSPETGCTGCHTGGLFTDLKAHDVGSTGRFDQGELRFDTPTLVELWRTAPYLHDGSCARLRELLTTRNPTDRHGRTSHLSRQQIDDLVEFLLSL